MNKKWIICFAVVLVIIMSLFGSCSNEVQPTTTTPTVTTTSTPTPETSAITEKVVLYFANELSTKLEKETREIKVNNKDEISTAIVKELISGPKSDKLINPISDTTKVNSVKVGDFIATVDFNEEFITSNTGGSTRETLCLYSIVNSLTQRNDIEKVKFTVNGKIIETFGSFDLSEPLRMDDSM